MVGTWKSLSFWLQNITSGGGHKKMVLMITFDYKVFFWLKKETQIKQFLITLYYKVVVVAHFPNSWLNVLQVVGGLRILKILDYVI